MSQSAVPPPSFWLDDVPGLLIPRPSFAGEGRVDFAVIGAGFTGLWTAYYLAKLRPDARVAVLEADVAGFGAAGRNGGWCTPHLTGIDRWIAGRHREQGMALQRAMFDAIDEVGRVSAAEGIDCDFAKAGFLNFTTNEGETTRIKAVLDGIHELGFSEDDYRWLDSDETDAKVRIAGARGGCYSPHGAALHPAKLARGLAQAIERLGVSVYERSTVRGIEPKLVVTDVGRMHADVVLVCTEGTTRHLDDVRRRIVPMHSMMIATEPLPAATWQEIGAADRVVFGDARRILSYTQRTADGRIALGAGGRYVYGSRVIRYFDHASPDFDLAEHVLTEFFPMLRGVRITHRWGGAFGVTRDWQPFVRFDEAAGRGAAGGYAGNGVAASNLAGRALAELVLGERSERMEHPWIQHASPAWEPEPLRWMAINAMLKVGRAADLSDIEGRSARLRSAFFDRFAAH